MWIFTAKYRNGGAPFFPKSREGWGSWSRPYAQESQAPLWGRDLHFITCSCYHRLPLFRSVGARNVCVRILDEAREQYEFALAGYVSMPEQLLEMDRM